MDKMVQSLAESVWRRAWRETFRGGLLHSGKQMILPAVSAIVTYFARSAAGDDESWFVELAVPSAVALGMVGLQYVANCIYALRLQRDEARCAVATTTEDADSELAVVNARLDEARRSLRDALEIHQAALSKASIATARAASKESEEDLQRKALADFADTAAHLLGRVCPNNRDHEWLQQRFEQEATDLSKDVSAFRRKHPLPKRLDVQFTYPNGPAPKAKLPEGDFSKTYAEAVFELQILQWGLRSVIQSLGPKKAGGA